MASLLFHLLLYLCSAVVCRASDLTNRFKAQVINTTWVPSDAQHFGKLRKLKCAQICSIADQCFAFHRTPSGDCYIMKDNKNWMEQRPKQNLTFWINQAAPETKCKAPAFPSIFGKSRYYFEKTNKKNWNDAAEFCESLGGMLAQISTEAELQYLWNMINTQNNNAENVFVGGFKDQNDGLPHEQGWKWRGSEEAFNSSFWRSGEPNNYRGEGEYCVGFWLPEIYLYDVSMSLISKFICECSTL